MCAEAEQCAAETGAHKSSCAGKIFGERRRMPRARMDEVRHAMECERHQCEQQQAGEPKDKVTPSTIQKKHVAAQGDAVLKMRLAMHGAVFLSRL
jgi:hypothetical protein